MSAIATISTQTNSDWVQGFQLQDVFGNARDMTGWTLAMMVRLSATSPQVFASISSPGMGIGITNAALGMYTLTITKAQLAAMAPNTYVHDLIAKKPDGTTEVIWTGTLIHSTGVTVI